MSVEIEKPEKKIAARLFEETTAARQRDGVLSPVVRASNPFSGNGRRLTDAEINSVLVTTELGRRCEELALAVWTGKLKPPHDQAREIAKTLDSFLEITFTGLEEIKKRSRPKILEAWLRHALQQPVAFEGHGLKIESPLRLPLRQLAEQISDILSAQKIYFPLPDFKSWGSYSENSNDLDGLYAIQATLIAARLITGRIPSPFIGPLFPHVCVNDSKGEKRAEFDGISYVPTGRSLVGSPLDEIDQHNLPWGILEVKGVFGGGAFHRYINKPQKRHLDQMYGQLGTAAIIWSRQNMEFPFPEIVTLLYLRGLYPPRRFDIYLGVNFFKDWLSFLETSLSKGSDENLEILQYELRVALAKAQKRS